MEIFCFQFTKICKHFYFPALTHKTEVKADTHCLSKGAFSIIETKVTKIDVDELCLEPKNSKTH